MRRDLVARAPDRHRRNRIHRAAGADRRARRQRRRTRRSRSRPTRTCSSSRWPRPGSRCIRSTRVRWPATGNGTVRPAASPTPVTRGAGAHPAHRPAPAPPAAGDQRAGRAVKALARQHQEAIWALNQTVSRLRSVLLEFYPQALQAFPNLKHKAALDRPRRGVDPGRAAKLTRRSWSRCCSAAAAATTPPGRADPHRPAHAGVAATCAGRGGTRRHRERAARRHRRDAASRRRAREPSWHASSTSIRRRRSCARRPGSAGPRGPRPGRNRR